MLLTIAFDSMGDKGEHIRERLQRELYSAQQSG